tara:strand:- start:5 stop:1090 length:1086 start_codon:yes stop_codon:yes gene_type:complete
MKIKLFDPHIGKAEENAVKKILYSKSWASGAGGGNVLEFEKEYSNYINCKQSIAVNSATSALNLALSLVDIKNKDVIVPSLTFVSTVNAIVINGGNPIFVDVDPTTLCINKKTIEEKISPKTKLILPVHFGGLSCNMHDIKKIATKYNLDIIDDAAHAAGTKFKGKKIGSLNFASCFSFHPVKNLAMPTGGIITLNDINFKKFTKILLEKRWCGIKNRTFTGYDVSTMGNNYYMNEFSAAIGRIQLKKLDKLNKIRLKIAKIYDQELNCNLKMPYNKECSYHLYWIRVKNRNKFRKILAKENIETGIHYPPVHNFSFYKNKNHSKLDVTDTVTQEIVTIPIHPNLIDSQINKIIKIINRNI